jgi:hypothetical protein
MENSTLQLMITAAAPIIAVGVKEYFDYKKRKQEVRLGTNKLIMERKLHLAEQTINLWRGQSALLSMISQLVDRAYENLEVLRSKEFHQLISEYCKQLDDIGKKSWEVTNAVELYFSFSYTPIDYDPYQKITEAVSVLQRHALEINDIYNDKNLLNEEERDPRIDMLIKDIRTSMKSLSTTMNDGIKQLNDSSNLLRAQFQSQLLT